MHDRSSKKIILKFIITETGSKLSLLDEAKIMNKTWMFRSSQTLTVKE